MHVGEVAHIPNPYGNGGTDIFSTPSAQFSEAVNPRAWHRPRKATMIQIICIGAGGGGGGGQPRASAADGGGGGGGGTGGIASLTIPAWFIPEMIWVSVGFGGIGGNAGVNTSGSGTRSLVLDRHYDDPNFQGRTLVISSTGQGGGGSNATTTSGGAAGIGASVTVQNDAAYSNIGIWSAIAGQSGSAGGAHTGANGAGVTWGASGVPGSGATGGAGSTGTDFAGGAITGGPGAPAGFVSPIAGGVANGGPGLDAIKKLFPPFLWAGGTGGGSDDNATGGKGGDGGIGCGGGGGGAGVTGGTGGKGGDGLIIISWW